MPRAIVHIDVPDVYNGRARATAAAEAIADLLGERSTAWTVSISEPANESAWLVRVSGEGDEWALKFDGLDQTAETIVKQFRLELTPYLRPS